MLKFVTPDANFKNGRGFHFIFHVNHFFTKLGVCNVENLLGKHLKDLAVTKACSYVETSVSCVFIFVR